MKLRRKHRHGWVVTAVGVLTTAACVVWDFWAEYRGSRSIPAGLLSAGGAALWILLEALDMLLPRASEEDEKKPFGCI